MKFIREYIIIREWKHKNYNIKTLINFNENQMRFALFIAAASAVTLVKDKAWPGAYRENNNDGVDVNFD